MGLTLDCTRYVLEGKEDENYTKGSCFYVLLPTLVTSRERICHTYATFLSSYYYKAFSIHLILIMSCLCFPFMIPQWKSEHHKRLEDEDK